MKKLLLGADGWHGMFLYEVRGDRIFAYRLRKGIWDEIFVTRGGRA